MKKMKMGKKKKMEKQKSNKTIKNNKKAALVNILYYKNFGRILKID